MYYPDLTKTSGSNCILLLSIIPFADLNSKRLIRLRAVRDIMLKEMLDQAKSKENQEDNDSSRSSGPTTDEKSEEDFQTIERNEADDDSEFETEEEDEEGDGQGRPTGSMFESLLRSHGLLGPRGARAQQEASARDSLHPFTQVLSKTNIDDCVAVENASFAEAERASREKVGLFLLVPIYAASLSVSLETLSYVLFSCHSVPEPFRAIDKDYDWPALAAGKSEPDL